MSLDEAWRSYPPLVFRLLQKMNDLEDPERAKKRDNWSRKDLLEMMRNG